MSSPFLWKDGLKNIPRPVQGASGKSSLTRGMEFISLNSMDGFVLAGGKSSRMGRNKALLDVGGKPIIQRVTEALTQAADRVAVISNAPEDYAFLGVPIVEDRVAGIGPLGGLHAALIAARSEVCLVVACDLPLIRPELLRMLAAEVAGQDAAVPCTEEGCHPLCAAYARTGLPAAEAQIRDGNYRVLGFLRQVRTRWVGPEVWSRADPEGLSFVNVNTPDAYEKARALLGGETRQG